jgi:dienelactone hydrolase
MGSGVMPWIQANGDYKKNHIYEIIKAAVKDLRRDGCTTVSIFGQCWGALMAVKAASEEDSPFLAAGGPHPSFVTVEAVKDIKGSLIILPSRDEADMVSGTNAIESGLAVEPISDLS